MKLSQIKGKDTLEVVADLIVPVSNMAQDERFVKLFERGNLPDGMSASDAAAERLRKYAPELIKTHKDDIISVLATVNMTDRDEYEANLNLATLTRDVVELINDEEFVGFFSSVVTS